MRNNVIFWSLWLLWIALIGLLLYASYQIGYMQRINEEREVIQVCSQAHVELNKSSEEKCGELQNKTGTEFICSQDRKYCWVEL